jgi:hypothetical protein
MNSDRPVEVNAVRELADMANRNAERPNPPSGPRAALVDQCRGLIHDRLNDVIAQAMSRITEDLTSEALRAKRYDHKLALLEAVMLVRENRLEIEERFRDSFAAVYLRRLAPNDSDQPATADSNSDELSLVSEDQVADLLQLERLIARARSVVDPQEALGVRARLGALTDREWFEESRHPVSPEAIYEALRVALKDVSARAEIQSALLDAFEPYVSRNLNGIYQSINQLLKSNHILPQIKQAIIPEGAANRGTAESADRTSQSRGAGASNARADDSGVDPSWTAESIDRLQSVLAMALSGQPAGLTRMARILANPAMLETERLPVQPVWAPLVDSLTALQQIGAGQTQGVSFPVLTKQVRDQGTPIDLVTVEIVGMVFDYIHGDRRLPDSIKQQLMRLQVVAVKAALLDRGFFARRQHPLRKLIDRISEVGADPDINFASGSPMLTGVEQLLTEVIGTFKTDLQIFEDAIEKVESIEREALALSAGSLAGTANVAARMEAEQLALIAARAEIEQRLTSNVPMLVREFLLDTWSRVMARTRAEQGDGIDAYAWGFALQSAEYLIWSVLPKRRDEIPRLASTLPRLIRDLNNGLDLIEFEPQLRTEFFEALMKEHTREIDSAKQRATRGEPDPIQVSISISHDGSVRYVSKEHPKSAVLPENDEIDVLLGDLKRGNRIEVAGEGDARVFKLAWVSPARTLFILSRHPDDSMTLQGSELATMLGRGLARVVSDESALDLAITSLTV